LRDCNAQTYRLSGILWRQRAVHEGLEGLRA
jgi:hypothetical protein